MINADVTSPYADIIRATRYLADRCDGAVSEDGAGFNMGDSFPMKRLALLSDERWTVADAAYARAALLKYHGQLSAISIDPRTFPTFKTSSAGRPRVVQYVRELDSFAVRFPYDERLLASFKQDTRGARWDVLAKEWRIAPTLENALHVVRWANANAVLLDPTVAEKLADLEAEVSDSPRFTPAPPINQRRLMARADGGYDVMFPYDTALVTAVKTISGVRWDKPRTRWYFTPARDNAAAAVTFLEQYDFDAPDEARSTLLTLLSEAVNAVALSRAASADFQVDGLGGTLRPFQSAGVSYAVNAQRTFIADEMGLGKTVQALAAVHSERAYPLIVICPASVKLNWKREAEKWLPGRTVHVMDGQHGPQDYVPDVLIINYDIVHKHLSTLLNVHAKALVCDECHYLKNLKTQRGKAVHALATGFEKLSTKRGAQVGAPIPLRLLLSGTPLVNRPSELVPQLEILDRLNDFGGWWKFNQRYLGFGSQWSPAGTGSSNEVELNDRLRTLCYVRRLKRDVLKELPPKERSVVPFEIDNRDEYDRAEDDLLAWLRESEEDADDKVAAATQAEHLVQINALRQLAAHGLLANAVSWIENFLESSDEKLVVFARHIEIQKALIRTFHCLSVTGDMNSQTRQENVDRFQEDNAARLIVCSLAAAGVGITLTAASNVAFVEYGWTPSDHDQAEDRCHRIGQTDTVNAYYLHAENTIYDDLAKLIESKRKVVSAVADGVVGDEGVGVIEAITRGIERRKEARGKGSKRRRVV